MQLTRALVFFLLCLPVIDISCFFHCLIELLTIIQSLCFWRLQQLLSLPSDSSRTTAHNGSLLPCHVSIIFLASFIFFILFIGDICLCFLFIFGSFLMLCFFDVFFHYCCCLLCYSFLVLFFIFAVVFSVFSIVSLSFWTQANVRTKYRLHLHWFLVSSCSYYASCYDSC